MRIANRRSDPGYHPDWRFARVFLDGRELKGACHAADEEHGFITRYKRDDLGNLIIESGEGIIETVHGAVRIDLERERVKREKRAYWDTLIAESQFDIIERLLHGAQERAAEEGCPTRVFLVEATAGLADLLGLIEPKLTIEFLQACAAVHGDHDASEYEAVKTRLAKAKAALFAASEADERVVA